MGAAILVQTCSLDLRIAGAGPRVLQDGVRSRLRLLGRRAFASGWVHLRHAVEPGA